MINLASFQKMMTEKIGDRIPAKEIPSRVMQVWDKFDVDGNNFVDFGEFLHASFDFDTQRLRNILNKYGAKNIFQQYQEDGFISEASLFTLMDEMKFTLATTSDCRKLIKDMDADKDGMISEQDMLSWSQRKNTEFEQYMKACKNRDNGVLPSA